MTCAGRIHDHGLADKTAKSGKAEMDAAPTMQHIQVNGMVLYNPPKAVPLIFPVRYMIAPMDMKRRALNRTSLKTWATAPFMARAVPMPMPHTMKPTWLIRL